MLKTESYKKGIIKSSALNVIVKLFSFINTLAIAFYFGVTIETDLYFYIFSTVVLISSLINGMDLTVIIPEGMHLEQKEGQPSAMLFYNSFVYLYLILGVLLFVLLFFFSVPVFQTISAFETNVLRDHQYLLIISSTLPLFLILSNYLTSILTAFKYFTAPIIANGIAYVLALITLIIFHSSVGISAVMIGLVLGYGLNVILLLVFMYTKLKWRFGCSLKNISARIKKNLLSVQLGNVATFAFNYGVIVLLSGLAAGVYSAYTYSMQVINIPVIFLVSQASAVAGIKFNELAAKNLHNELNKIFEDSIGILLFLIVPFCFITYVYTDVIVNFLFLRGDFTKESADKVILFLKYLIFLAPLFTINTFISKVMTATKKISQAFYYQLGFNLILLLLLVIVTKYYTEYGFIFTMLSVYAIYIIVICMFLFRSLLPFIRYVNILKSLAVIILSNTVLISIYYTLFGRDHSMTNFIIIAVSYYLALFIANYFLKLNNSVHTYMLNTLQLISKKTK